MIREPRCIFDFAANDTGRLVCQGHGRVHMLHLYVDAAGRMALLRGLRDRGQLTGSAAKAVAEMEAA